MSHTPRRCPGCSTPVGAHRDHPWCAACHHRMPSPVRSKVESARHQLAAATSDAVKWLQLHPHATRRELDVLTLVADGLGNAAIADRLGISTETVKAYLTQLTKRWGCTGRAHLVATAYRLGHLKTRGSNP